MAKDKNFFTVCYRYIDDIFVIQNKRKFDLVKKLFEDTLDNIENDTVKYTFERQVNNKLPFLNTLVEIVDDTLTIDVYRKPSSTQRLITSDSHHDMAHFMVNLPLTKEKTEREIKNIVEIGRVNGYHESMIMNIVEKHHREKELCKISTFYETNKPDDQLWCVISSTF